MTPLLHINEMSSMTVLLIMTTTVYFSDFALNSILIDERLGFFSDQKNPRLAIIPPKAPTLQRILENNGYQVSTVFHKEYIAYAAFLFFQYL